MTDGSSADYYENIRGRVRGLFISVDPFPADEAALIDELIDANEPGVALEMLIAMLIERGTTIPSPLVDQFADLVRTMDLSPELAYRVEGLATS